MSNELKTVLKEQVVAKESFSVFLNMIAGKEDITILLMIMIMIMIIIEQEIILVFPDRINYTIPGSVYFLLYLFLRNPDLLKDELQHLSKIQKCQVRKVSKREGRWGERQSEAQNRYQFPTQRRPLKRTVQERPPRCH